MADKTRLTAAEREWRRRARTLLLQYRACVLDLRELDGRSRWDVDALNDDLDAFLAEPRAAPS